MLRDFRIHPLLATSDAVRARAWYADKLGLEPVFEREGQLVYSVPPTVFTVYGPHQRGLRRTPSPSGRWTTCGPRWPGCGPAA